MPHAGIPDCAKPIWRVVMGVPFLPSLMPIFPLLAMHIPDGFLSPGIAIAGWAIALVTLVLVLRESRQRHGDALAAHLGVAAAFVFAAQMINFPIPGGTSGHLLGGTLLGILLGRRSASLAMALVFAVQALVFQDGGIASFGANYLNMGLIGCWGGTSLWQQLLRLGLGRNIAAGIAAWASVVVAAIACALELALSGTIPLMVALPALLGWHLLIGVGEGAITATIVGFLGRVRPDLLTAPAPVASR
jgi:cobalt/nickel transport system permease protein